MKLLIVAGYCLLHSAGISLLILAGQSFALSQYIQFVMLVQIPVAVTMIHISYQQSYRHMSDTPLTDKHERVEGDSGPCVVDASFVRHVERESREQLSIIRSLVRCIEEAGSSVEDPARLREGYETAKAYLSKQAQNESA